MMTHADAIDLLGGYRALAREIGCSPVVTWRWQRERGIPARRWLDLSKLARRKGVRGITVRALAAAAPQRGAA